MHSRVHNSKRNRCRKEKPFLWSRMLNTGSFISSIILLIFAVEEMARKLVFKISSSWLYECVRNCRQSIVTRVHCLCRCNIVQGAYICTLFNPTAVTVWRDMEECALYYSQTLTNMRHTFSFRWNVIFVLVSRQNGCKHNTRLCFLARKASL